MPALIDNHNKKVVETRLEKFYSSINQAIKMAELDYGAREDWWETISDYDEQKAWCEKYIIPYMNVTKTGKVNNYFTIYFADGSAVSRHSNGSDWWFYPSSPEKCLESCNNKYYACSGKCSFEFYYNPTSSSAGNYYYTFEPYTWSWDGTLDNLKYADRCGCYNEDNNSNNWRGLCTRLIQYNGWKIPKDYPYRVK